MKTKTIKSIIHRKINWWLNSIDDLEVRNLLKSNVLVSGGCIASMLLNEEVNDFDVYFQTQEATKAAAEYYLKHFKQKITKSNVGELPAPRVVVHKDGQVAIVIQSAGVASEAGTEQPYDFFEGRADDQAATDYVAGMIDSDPETIQDMHDETKKKVKKTNKEKKESEHSYRPIFITSNAITLSDDIQLIIRFYGSPAEIHKNFDYVHCTNYWNSKTNDLVLNPLALESLLTKELKYVGSLFPIASIIRMRKFIKRGWDINAGQILKMTLQAHDLNLKDPNILRNQLVGVDVSYFHQLQEALKVADPTKINSAYIIELIDRLL